MFRGRSFPRNFSGKRNFVFSLLFISLFTAGLLAQAMPAAVVGTADGEAAIEVLAPSRGLDEIVSIEFRSTEAADVLRYLAQKASMNISISTKVAGRVSIIANDVPIRDIFDIVLRSNALAYEMQGNVYNIMTEAEYKELYGEKFSDLRVVKTFRLNYALPEQAFNLLDTIKSSIGRLLIDEKSGTIMIMDTPAKIAEMEKALDVLESSETVKVIDLKYAKAIEVEEKLKDDLETNNLGTIKADVRTNQIIVRAFPQRLIEMMRLIEALDRKTREVFIDARIVKVTIRDEKNTGIDWGTFFEKLEFHGVDRVGDFRPTTDATTPGDEVPNVTRVPFGSKFGLDKNGTFGKEAFGELLFSTIDTDGYEIMRFLQTLGDTKIISKPQLLVTENQAAKIHVGTREAYVTATTTTGSSSDTTAEEVNFIDVGIKFAVTPRITSDGFIEMLIQPEVSSVVRTLVSSRGTQVPIVDTSTAETNVIVKDGTTVIIAGLRENEKIESNAEVPYLGRVPLFGNLFFKKYTRDNEINELVIFITPHIADGERLITGDEKVRGGGIKPYRDYSKLKPART